MNRGGTFKWPFEPARYFMPCFIEDPESAPGTSRMDLGMYAEFRVDE